MDTGEIRDLLPDWVGGRLESSRARMVERAVADDADLRAEAELLRSLAAGRSPVPEGLGARITARVLGERRFSPAGAPTGRVTLPWLRWRAPAWAVAAAAMLILALGIAVAVDRAGPGSVPASDPLTVALESAPSPWVADDGTVAGAPVLDGLSDEALATLLEELGG